MTLSILQMLVFAQQKAWGQRRDKQFGLAQLFFDLKMYVELRDQKVRVSTLLSGELGVL